MLLRLPMCQYYAAATMTPAEERGYRENYTKLPMKDLARVSDSLIHQPSTFCVRIYCIYRYMK
jgi:hypothetical protein